jgi:hypothetical protein
MPLPVFEIPFKYVEIMIDTVVMQL